MEQSLDVDESRLLYLKVSVLVEGGALPFRE